MIKRLYRPLVMGVLPIALIACMTPAPTVAEHGSTVPLGIDLGGSGPVAASPPPQAPIRTALAAEGHASHLQRGSEVQLVHEGGKHVQASGTVNSIDPAQHKLNIKHDPIAQIGWPTMTMDFPVAPAVDLRSIKPGMRVNFTIEQGQGGMYQIQSISPAGGGR
jgi:Cu/Ag efflux protein CusF